MAQFLVRCCLGMLLPCWTFAGAGDSASPGRDWLMMVVTNNKDPAREAEFNHWYDDIDLPDVFTVPGYMRARRGQGQAVPEFPSADLQPDEGKFVALYDIDSEDIDGTIINMLLLARKMDNTGRSTDLLEVTERLYFRRLAPGVNAPNSRSSDGNPYLYLVRVDCCAGVRARREFNAWYDGTLLPALLQARGVRRATRYELHRVVMTDPIAVPRYLTVFEINAASAADAVRYLHDVMEGLRAGGRMDDRYREGGATLYLNIKDVNRPGKGGT
ncbi:MAG: hypothetical protein HYR49_06190 [Gammaproteobacteria bacterium]|nr:hypothetical protein [Gammaproteobacteria bacterium]